MGKLDNDRHEAFCQQYTVDRNATQAYIRAGYKAKTADACAARLQGNARVKARIAELLEKLAEKIELKAEAIVRRYAQIAFADPNELTQIRAGACRYCHGADHDYQWRTQREFGKAAQEYDARTKAAKAKATKPDKAGGFGYSRVVPPHPDCPECDGLGETYTVFRDTTRLEGDAKLLYAGVKDTNHGFEIKLTDQLAALGQLARHFGLFDNESDRNHRLAPEFRALLDQINAGGSRARTRDPLDRAKAHT